MDYAHRRGLSADEWRLRGRAEVQRCLAYSPKPVALDVRVHSVAKRDGYEVRTISFAGSAHYRVPAYLLVPDKAAGKRPGVVALHDHGGWFYHGKEKLVRMEGEHVALSKFREQYYGGRSYADELARRGFVVLVPDAFYWGERRLQYQQPPKELQERLAGLQPDQPEYVQAFNRWARERNMELNTWLSFSGTTWMGIVNHDDRRSVDVLASLPEVDAGRIGCLGLSGGGYRSTYLVGMEPRIRAAVITGWMTSLPATLEIPYSVHGALFDAFGVHQNLDHPDIASLAAPDAAVFVQNCARDRLFTRNGMEAAAGKIRAVYSDLKRPERYGSKFYDVPHQFNVEMQDEAFDWLAKWLGPVSNQTGTAQPGRGQRERFHQSKVATRVVIVVGPSTHAPGTHEVAAGGRLMQWALENMANVPDVKADVLYEWPSDRRVFQDARGIVFIGDIFPPQRMPDRAAALNDVGELMKAGVGIACVHYATGLRAEDVEPNGAHPLLGWLGGYFATRTPHHQSVAKVFQSVTVSPAETRHPVLRGWRQFTIDDEPYYNNYFGPDGNKPARNVTPLATAILPPEAPKREVVAWATTRADGGRGFAIVMPHFYKNWANDELRRFILNGIVWTAKLDVPGRGVRTPPPDLSKFEPESVEPKQRSPSQRQN